MVLVQVGIVHCVLSCDVHGTGGRKEKRWLCLCVVWYKWVLCTTYSAVDTGGCDVHGTGGRREERWLARLLGGDTAPPSIRGVRLVLNI